MLVNLPDQAATLEPADWMAHLQAEKQRVRTEMEASRQRLEAQMRAVAEPAPEPANKWEAWMGMVSRGMSLYKGVTTGLLVVRALRGMFDKRKR